MDNNVEVRIVGDASGVQPAVDSATASIGGLKQTMADVTAFLDGVRAKFTEFGTTGKEAGEKLEDGMLKAKQATEAEGNAITRMIMKVHEGAESVRTFQQRAKEFAEVYVAMFAVESVMEWISKLAEAGERMQHLAIQLGMTTAQVQGLSASAKLSGIDMEILSKSLAQMDNRAVTSAGSTSAAGKAMQAMGIAAGDGSSNMERLLKVADKFHGMADGPEKTALAMQLFGRAGREMIPYLNQGSEAIQKQIDVGKELGAVNDKAEEQQLRMASSVNEAKVAWDGMLNTLSEAFGPVLTELVDGFIGMVKAMHDSYEAGGFVRQLFDGLSSIVRGFIEIIYAVGMGFEELFGSTDQKGDQWGKQIADIVKAVVDAFKNVILFLVYVKDSFVASYDMISAVWLKMKANIIETNGGIKTDFAALGEFVKVVANVIYDAVHLNWSAVKSDWEAGMEHVRQVVTQKSNEILAVTAHLRAQAQSDMAAAAGMQGKYDAFQKNLFGKHTPGHDGFEFPKGGGTGDAPDLAKTPKPKKEKKGKDDLVQHLQEELEAEKAAWEEKQIEQGTAQEYSLQSEAKFWAEALKRTDLSAKDKMAIEQKWIQAEKKIQADAWGVKLEGYKEDLSRAGQNAAAKLAILQKEAAETKRMFGEKSKEARAADAAVVAADREAAKQMIALKDEVANGERALQEAKIQAAEATADFEVTTDRMSVTKRLQLQRTFEQQRFEIERAALLQRLKLMASDPGHDPVAYAKLVNQIEQLESQHQAKLTEIDRKAVLARTKLERDAMGGIAQGFAQNLAKMATLQQGFMSTMKGLWQSLQNVAEQVLEAILQKFIMNQLVKLGLMKAETAATIKGHMAAAGAGGTASMAAAPFPLDLTAPAFGASMASAAGAFASVSMAEKGDWQVREGMYHLHEDEMVLPAWAAKGMRAMIGGTGGGGSSPPGQPANDGGATHLHFHGPTDRRGIERWFADNRNGVREGARAMSRKGGAVAMARR